MLRDLVYSWRVLSKNQIATLVTILALALGIGANASSFVGVNSIVLHPYTYPGLDRIMTLWGTLPKTGLTRAGVAAGDFEDWKQRGRSFEILSAYERWPANITGTGRPEPVQAARVGSGFFDIFGMKPVIGRIFTSEETRAAVISNGAWRTRFGASLELTGKTIALAGQTYTVLGVMPADFDYPLATEVWVPLVQTPAQKADRQSHGLLAVGKLRSDVTPGQAAAELRTISMDLEREYPKTNAGWSADVTPLTQIAESTTNRFIQIIFISSFFLLLLAGANVANIQLAQAMNRRKTIVIEAALGASRYRIARSLFLQSLLLSLAGGAGALIAVHAMNDINRAAFPAMVYQIVPGLRNMAVDANVVAFTIAISILTGFLCSLPAILHLIGRGTAPALSETLGQDRSVAGDSRHRMRDILVIGEVVMAIVLLVGAGVMISTFGRAQQLELGFNPSNLLTAQISLLPQNYAADPQITTFYDRALADLSSIPNVQNVSLETSMGTASDFRIEGHADLLPSDPKPAIRVVDPNYFRTMQLPLIAGRAISPQDTADAARVIVIGKSVADRYWPDADPLGRRVRFGQSPWLTIVGVSGDTVQWFTKAPEPAAYTPYAQKPGLNARLLLRTAGDPSLAETAVVAKIRAIDPTEPVYQMKSMEQFYFEERSGVQAALTIMENNALIALFLALTGIYGVISYFVSQRTREIGIRIAVGASKSDIVSMTLGEAVRLAGIGLAVGVPMTYLLTRALASALYNVVVIEWTTFATVTGILALAALLAAWLPARRAADVDPVIALRNV